MKKKTTLFTVITLFLLMGGMGCEEEKKEIINPPYIENSGTLLGTWYWEKSYVPGPPSSSNPQTPQNIGIIKLLTLKNDSSWMLKEDNKETRGEKFTIGKGLTYDPYMTEIKYDSIAFYQDKKIVRIEYFRLYGNTLDFCWDFRGTTGSGLTRWKYIIKN